MPIGNDMHAFRQTQTAIVVQNYLKEGWSLLHYQIPVRGQPWEVIFECPIYQTIVYMIMKVFGRTNVDLWCRLISVATFYLSFFMLKKIVETMLDEELSFYICSVYLLVVAIAAMIGGITYFHTYAYDLLAENERILASTFDAAIWAHEEKHLEKINVLSSSMVYGSTNHYPSSEGEQLTCPPPLSTYGFQKLACEYFAKGAWEQYKLPYTIIRPFNCVGIGEQRAKDEKEIRSGNVKLAMSHVVPDLVQKVYKGQDPLHILGSGDQIWFT